MKYIFYLSFILFCPHTYGQIKEKVNIDFSQANIECQINTEQWRLVTYQEYIDNNPRSLDFLNEASIFFYRGYVLKGESDINQPPALMIQAVKVPEQLTVDMLKHQANEIVSEEGFMERMAEEYKKIHGEEPALLSAFIGESRYFDSRLNALIMQVELPGAQGEAHIMHTATFFKEGQLTMFKLISLKNSQKHFLMEFTDFLNGVKITD